MPYDLYVLLKREFPPFAKGKNSSITVIVDVFLYFHSDWSWLCVYCYLRSNGII